MSKLTFAERQKANVYAEEMPEELAWRLVEAESALATSASLVVDLTARVAVLEKRESTARSILEDLKKQVASGTPFCFQDVETWLAVQMSPSTSGESWRAMVAVLERIPHGAPIDQWVDWTAEAEAALAAARAVMGT